jgi:hypothetical protein
MPALRLRPLDETTQPDAGAARRGQRRLRRMLVHGFPCRGRRPRQDGSAEPGREGAPSREGLCPRCSRVRRSGRRRAGAQHGPRAKRAVRAEQYELELLLRRAQPTGRDADHSGLVGQERAGALHLPQQNRGCALPRAADGSSSRHRARLPHSNRPPMDRERLPRTRLEQSGQGSDDKRAAKARSAVGLRRLQLPPASPHGLLADGDSRHGRGRRVRASKPHRRRSALPDALPAPARPTNPPVVQ